MTYGIWFKEHMLTGVSYMIPVVVAVGLCMAIAKICDVPFVANATQTVPWFINQLGVVAMVLVVQVLTAGIAYSIAEIAGIAPGLILGFIALEIKAGFLGGMLAGFLVGYVILAIRRFLKLPSSMQGLMPAWSPPIGVAISVFIQRCKRYSQGEIDAAKAAFPLGLCFITEGVLPFAAADPLRVIPACMAGAAAAAGLTMLWNVTSTVPHGGIFVIPIMGNPWGAALIIGCLITAAVMTILKPVLKASDAQSKTEEETEIDDFEISIKHQPRREHLFLTSEGHHGQHTGHWRSGGHNYR